MPDLELMHGRLNGVNVVYAERCDSTNTLLKQDALSYPDRTLLFTFEQTGGRGRLGRKWVSEPGEGVAMSLLLHRPDLSRPLSLMAGLAAARAIGGPCRLKWPNDVLYSGKKVGGILCESVYGSSPRAVIGLGINLYQPAERFTDAGLPNGSSLLALTGMRVPAEELICRIVSEFLSINEEFESEAFIAEYTGLCLNIGRRVTAGEVSGEAVGVSSGGGLLVQTPEGIREITSGEVAVHDVYRNIP